MGRSSEYVQQQEPSLKIVPLLFRPWPSRPRPSHSPMFQRGHDVAVRCYRGTQRCVDEATAADAVRENDERKALVTGQNRSVPKDGHSVGGGEVK